MTFTGSIAVDALDFTDPERNMAGKLELLRNPPGFGYFAYLPRTEVIGPGNSILGNSGLAILRVDGSGRNCVLQLTDAHGVESTAVFPASTREEADAILENLGLSIRQGEFG